MFRCVFCCRCGFPNNCRWLTLMFRSMCLFRHCFPGCHCFPVSFRTIPPCCLAHFCYPNVFCCCHSFPNCRWLTVMFRSMYCCRHYIPDYHWFKIMGIYWGGYCCPWGCSMFCSIVEIHVQRSVCCCCYRFPCCHHGIIGVLLLSLLPWLPLVACFVQNHVFLSSGSLLLPQFDQACILLLSWLPDCRCFTLMFRSMYCCRLCFHSCHWFKITGILGCGSVTRKDTAALGVAPARFRKFTIRSVCCRRYHLCWCMFCCRHGFPNCRWLTFTFESMY